MQSYETETESAKIGNMLIPYNTFKLPPYFGKIRFLATNYEPYVLDCETNDTVTPRARVPVYDGKEYAQERKMGYDMDRDPPYIKAEALTQGP